MNSLFYDPTLEMIELLTILWFVLATCLWVTIVHGAKGLNWACFLTGEVFFVSLPAFFLREYSLNSPPIVSTIAIILLLVFMIISIKVNRAKTG